MNRFIMDRIIREAFEEFFPGRAICRPLFYDDSAEGKGYSYKYGGKVASTYSVIWPLVLEKAREEGQDHWRPAMNRFKTGKATWSKGIRYWPPNN